MQKHKKIISLIFFVSSYILASEIIDYRPLTDSVFEVVFKDGRIEYFGYHQTGNDDKTFLSILNTTLAQTPSSWSIISPDDSNYSSQKNPISVYRKSKGVEWSLKCLWDGTKCNNDVISEHRIYLKLPFPMQRDKTYIISCGFTFCS